MEGVFNFLLGEKETAAPLPPLRGSVTKTGHAQWAPISYDHDLIPQLKEEHQQLLKLYGMINRAFEKNDLALTVHYLEDFRRKVHSHFLTEGIRFYIYLEHSLPENSKAFELVHGFRQEMGAIEKDVVAFLSKHKDLGAHPDFAAQFGNDLKEVGARLVSRIRREEETLFPLYFLLH
jgi:hypothetical protein